jgi:hypothetical protein
MIDRQKLLADLQDLLKKVEADLLERSDSAEVSEVGRKLRDGYAAAQAAKRTAQSFEEWRSDTITQAAAAWVLSCVFLRFLEDNDLVDSPKIAGPGERLKRARDEHELYFRSHPTFTDRDYLLAVFDGLSTCAATKDVFGEHNPIRDLLNWLSGDAATALIVFFQKIEPNTGSLVHDFTDPAWDTRFLGDLYQDLSEAARKKYALLQTPIFVEEFILNRTLDAALEEFGLARAGYEERVEPDGRLSPNDRFRMIDPACGSGHFLLGSFARLVDRWRKREPGTRNAVLVQRALDSVHGVDLNPYAIAIARFRLLLAALKQCGVRRLKDAVGFVIHLVCGDSLLHGAPGGDQLSLGWTSLDHVYQPEDADALGRILRPKYYHAVVANPPYITPKDAALNQAYRDRYLTCHRQYSLAVPFLERIVSLAVDGGFTGQITANSFMKREFGKKLVEEFFPRVDLTHVIDTSGAYVPGHGTPTVILFARNRKPVTSMLRTVMGIRGEPSTPDNPAQGLVWLAIVNQADEPGSQSEFVSVGDSPRDLFHRHPWSIGGGGASDLKAFLDEAACCTLTEKVNDCGFGALTRDDDAYLITGRVALRSRVEKEFIKPFITGENVRDWSVRDAESALWPYHAESLGPVASPAIMKCLWPYRRQLCDRVAYGQSQVERGLTWFEYSMFFKERYKSTRLIAFASVSTHNHFVLAQQGCLLNRHAPIIKLPTEATEDDHFALLALLNSSTACFWMKQVFQPKSHASQRHHPDPARAAYEFSGTQLLELPVVIEQRERWNSIARALSLASQERQRLLDYETLARHAKDGTLKQYMMNRWREADAIRERMVALQEELDWLVYRGFGLTADDDTLATDVPIEEFSCPRGERPFEVLSGRRSLIRRHGEVVPLSEAECPPVGVLANILARAWSARFQAIKAIPALQMIERVEYKRLWRDTDENLPEKEYRRSRDAAQLKDFLLARLESYFDRDDRMGDAGTGATNITSGLNGTRIA